MTKNFQCYIGNNFGFTFEVPSIDSFDAIYFVIREDIFEKETLVKTKADMDKIADNKYRVKLSAEETNNFMPLNYLYGLQVVYGTNIKTVLEGKFIADIDPARSEND